MSGRSVGRARRFTVSGYAGTLGKARGAVNPVTTGEAYTSFYLNDDFDNIFDAAMITIAGTTANLPTVSASDISVEAEPGTLSIGDTITVSYDAAGAGQNVTDVSFDLMQFTAEPNHQNLTPDHVDGTVYSLTLTLNEGIIDGAYGRAFVTVTGDGGVNYVTADDESFFVDIDTPMADEMALEPGSGHGREQLGRDH